MLNLAHRAIFEGGAGFHAEAVILAAAHIVQSAGRIFDDAATDGGGGPTLGGLNVDLRHVIGAPAGGSADGGDVRLRLVDVRAGVIGGGGLLPHGLQRLGDVGAGLFLIARLDAVGQLGGLPGGHVIDRDLLRAEHVRDLVRRFEFTALGRYPIVELGALLIVGDGRIVEDGLALGGGLRLEGHLIAAGAGGFFDARGALLIGLDLLGLALQLSGLISLRAGDGVGCALEALAERGHAAGLVISLRHHARAAGALDDRRRVVAECL